MSFAPASACRGVLCVCVCVCVCVNGVFLFLLINPLSSPERTQGMALAQMFLAQQKRLAVRYCHFVRPVYPCVSVCVCVCASPSVSACVSVTLLTELSRSNILFACNTQALPISKIYEGGENQLFKTYLAGEML